MSYKFYYDESEHSRVINQKTVNADNYYDNFITAIVGWDEVKESIIEKRYFEFEEKYAYRKSKGELKSTTFDQKQFRCGLSSMTNDNLQMINDFLDIFDDDILLYFSVQSKFEYIIYQLLDGYSNSMLLDADALKYSLIKGIHTYRPTAVIDSIYNHPEDLVKEIREFLAAQIERNKGNLLLKERENTAFEQALLVLHDIHGPVTLNWDYHMPFEGFRLFLNEQSINDYRLIIDKEGRNQNTLKAALDLGHIEAEEMDSIDSFGLRIADFIAGIIAKFMKALCNALTTDYSELKKVVLDKKWFDLNEGRHEVYTKLHHVLSGINNCWYKSYAGVFADDLIAFIALLEYIDRNTIDEMKANLSVQGEKFNRYLLNRLEAQFAMTNNKLSVEPITVREGEFFINKWGAKVFVDSKKQPVLEVNNGHRECLVMNAGVDSKGIPTITINENGKNECYRISEQLTGWVQMLIGFVSMGEELLPSKVLFSIRDGKWYADLL